MIGDHRDGTNAIGLFGDETSEPSVMGWMPAAAVYFRAPDGHMIEYLAMVEEPPAGCRHSSRGRIGSPPRPERRTSG